MGKFDVLKIVRTIRLAEYAEEYGEAVIHVWVNPPRPMLAAHDALVLESGMLRKGLEPLAEGARSKERPAEESAPSKPSDDEIKKAVGRLLEISTEHLAWFATIWSQGPEGTHWTAQEVGELVDAYAETDPRFFEWVSERTVALIREHRTGQKKG